MVKDVVLIPVQPQAVLELVYSADIPLTVLVDTKNEPLGWFQSASLCSLLGNKWKVTTPDSQFYINSTWIINIRINRDGVIITVELPLKEVQDA